MREGPEVFVPGPQRIESPTEADLTKALTRLAEAIQRQSESLDALINVIASQHVEDADQSEAGVYLDGTPINGRGL